MPPHPLSLRAPLLLFFSFSQDGDLSTSALTSNDPTSKRRGNAKSQCHQPYQPKPEVDASQTYSPSWVPLLLFYLVALDLNSNGLSPLKPADRDYSSVSD